MGELVLKSLGQADAAGTRQAVGHLVGDEILVDPGRGRAVRELGLDYRLLGLGQKLPQQDGLKLLAGFADLLVFRQLLVAGERLERDVARVDPGLGLGGGDVHQRVMSSACKAPACFMAWKIPIMSRGVAPRAFSADASFS